MGDPQNLSLTRKRKSCKDLSIDTKKSMISTHAAENKEISKQENINNAKRHQPSYTFKQKLSILKKLETEPLHTILKKFNLNDRTLRRWRKKRHEIEALSKKENISDHKKNRPPGNQDLEDALYIWFSQARTGGVPISGPILKKKAIEINEELGGDKSFRASDGWLDNWKRRKDIRSLRITGEKGSTDFDAGNDYANKLKTIVASKTLTRTQVFNFSETSLLYKMLPSMTLASSHESQAAGFKVDKERVTIAACCNADGSYKLPLLVVGKFAKPRYLKDLSSANLPVLYKSQKNALIDVNIFTEWFKEIFVPRVRTFLIERGLHPRAILIVDDCKNHTYLKDGDIEVTFLSANEMSIVNPLDQEILEYLKRHYKLNLINKILEAQKNQISSVQFVKNINVKDAIFWIDESWQKITKNTIYRYWNKIWYAKKRCVAVQTDHDPAALTLLDSVEVSNDENLIIGRILSELVKVNGYKNIEKSRVYDWICDDNDLGEV
ncbi:jerky protein homolog-like isoform X5 [Microplitis mediator]|uniref:jerky protein homolog-like isoform X5 n=1 Tax=Microplitis mediator TaxID=375433 RepID=UPI002556B5FB|nr:jerky protein homolog-like isoform X5 [Microplitis mediator]